VQYRFKPGSKLADWQTRDMGEPAPVDASAPTPDCQQPAFMAADAAQVQVLETEAAATPPRPPIPAQMQPIVAHLSRLAPDPKWPAQADADLMRYSVLRWPVGDAAAELGRTVGECKDRLIRLTDGRSMAFDKVHEALLLLHGLHE